MQKTKMILLIIDQTTEWCHAGYKSITGLLTTIPGLIGLIYRIHNKAVRDNSESTLKPCALI